MAFTRGKVIRPAMVEDVPKCSSTCPAFVERTDAQCGNNYCGVERSTTELLPRVVIPGDVCIPYVQIQTRAVRAARAYKHEREFGDEMKDTYIPKLNAMDKVLDQIERGEAAPPRSRRSLRKRPGESDSQYAHRVNKGRA